MADETYDKVLTQEARELVAAAGQGAFERADFRDREIEALLAALDARRSVLLVGAAGVGKSAVLHEVARTMAGRKRGEIFEVSTALLLAGTRYIGEWQTKVTRVASAAAKRKAALVVTDVAHLAKAGRTVQSETTMLDALRSYLESGELAIVGEVTPETLRAMQRTPSFVTLFEQIEIAPLGPDEVLGALERAAARRDAELDHACRRTLVELTSRFLAARPQPGPALSLFDEVLDYQAEKQGIGEAAPITPAFVERVFSITSGLPPLVVSRSVTMPAADIRAWFSDRIIGQGAAIAAVVEMIALFKAGLHDPAKPIGTFLFVGPTGVGKTELARALATFLFGGPERLLRFDLSEFKDYSSFEMLLGDAQHPDKPARLIDPVRAQPFQVVLLDEIEKAHANVWDLLLPLLDDGRLTTPSGDTVDFRNTIVIATSNVGAQDAEKSVGFGTAPDAGRREAHVKRALEAAFRPELLNRFQHVVVFHALSKEQLRAVARQEITRVLTREGIAANRLSVDVEDAALDLVIDQGVDARFGARALKREVQRRVVLPLAMTLMEQRVLPGSILRVVAVDGALRVRVVDTEESRREARDARDVARQEEARAKDRVDLGETAARLTARVERLAEGAGETALVEERERLEARRGEPAFWGDAGAQQAVARELDRVVGTLDRLARLRQRGEALRVEVGQASARQRAPELAGRSRDLEAAIDHAERELLRMGWDGSAEALVEVRPFGAHGRAARDLLVTTYLEWAKWTRRPVELVREPRDDDEPALLGVQGPYAYGLLRGEAGLHRLRLAAAGEDVTAPSVASVRVAPWTEAREPAMLVRQRPLKALGQYGGKIRARLECAAGVEVLVVQGPRTLAEARALAAELVVSWAAAPRPPDDVVRRYQQEPPLVRDALTSTSTGRPDALAPRAFDALLKARVDAASASATTPTR